MGSSQPNGDNKWLKKFLLYCKIQKSKLRQYYLTIKVKGASALRWIWWAANVDIVRDESATAICTALILAATCTYAYFAYLQSEAMNSSSRDTHDLAVTARTQSDQAIAQTTTMEKTLNLQVAIAAGPLGAAKMQVQGMAIYNEGRKVRISVALWNTGNREASQISAYIRVGFGKSPLAPIPKNLEAPPKPTKPDHLPPHRPQQLARIPDADATASIPPGLGDGDFIYISGRVLYTDLRSVTIPLPFCLYVPARAALNISSGTTGHWFSETSKIPYKNCESSNYSALNTP